MRKALLTTSIFVLAAGNLGCPGFLPENGFDFLDFPDFLDPRCEGPDPRADSIDFELVAVESDTTGVVRVTGVVINNGQSAFESGEGQQDVFLYEGEQLVATQPFVNLDVDETVEVVYERDWNVSSEFKPSDYRLVISYDPDIRLDGNPDNDDCATDNNELTRGTGDIDALFE